MTPSSYSPPALKKIAERVRNFRDLAKFCQGYIKEGMVYRTSSMIKHQDQSLLDNLKLLDVKGIIDLRSEIEIVRDSYNDYFMSNFNYFWVHLDISMPTKILEENNVANLPFYHQFCWYVLFYNKYEIQRVFHVLSKKRNYSFVMHCHEGRDRTGVISALILLLLNAPETNIIQDYLATDQYTRTEDIEYIIRKVEEEGGINNYLLKMGVEENIQNKIIEILKP